jgi:hypothetical protein
VDNESGAPHFQYYEGSLAYDSPSSLRGSNPAVIIKVLEES